MDHEENTVSGQVFRDCIARVPLPVHIITTDGVHGRRGFTATAVASVSDAPPTLLVCLNRLSPQTEIFRKNGCLAVNLLPKTARDLADVFAGRGPLAGEARFTRGVWTRLATGAPILQDAVMALDCQLIEMKEAASHHVLFARVVATALVPPLGVPLPEILLYHERDYAHL